MKVRQVHLRSTSQKAKHHFGIRNDRLQPAFLSSKPLAIQHKYSLPQINCSTPLRPFSTKATDPKGRKKLSKSHAMKVIKGHNNSSTAWLRRQQTDPFVLKAQTEGYVSRAVYKLAEAQDRFKFIHPEDFVLELGSSPGSWSQFLVKKSKHVVGVDLIPSLINHPNFKFIHGDFLSPEIQNQIRELCPQKVDLLLSDMSPNISGMKELDHARILELNEEVLNFAEILLKPGGHILMKTTRGGKELQMKSLMEPCFEKVSFYKPKASRTDSPEIYFFASKFKPLN